MPRVALLLCLLLLLVIGVSAEHSAALPAPSVTRAVLDNGLTIIVAEQHAAELVTLNAWVKVGSRDETDELNGAAHFVEHMLFKGTRRRKVGQIDREVEGLGGILNASTAFDFTQYYITAASRFFDRILDLQADALMNSTFDPEEMERERRVVLEEIGLRDDCILPGTVWAAECHHCRCRRREHAGDGRQGPPGLRQLAPPRCHPPDCAARAGVQ